MGYIYKITNTVNGKVYVGQTVQGIQTRWKQHVAYSSDGYHGRKYPILYAIRKYGADAFIIEELEQCDDELLNEREIFWIKELGTTLNGYNISLGGNGWKKCSDEEIIFWWETGKTLIEIAEFIPLHPETISRRLQRLGITHKEILARGNKSATKNREFPVYQYDINGNFVREFENSQAAKDFVGLKHINFSSNAPEKTFGGYQWRRYKTDKIEPVNYKIKYRNKKAMFSEKEMIA